MAAACDLISVELRLDRIEAELASELPAHMRMFAAACARGTAPPPAPPVVHRPITLATARAALAHPLLADRGLALLRLVAPIAIEDDAGVAAARSAPPTWDALAQLATARDAAASALFGRRAIDVLHRVHGIWGAAPVGVRAHAPRLASESTASPADLPPRGSRGGASESTASPADLPPRASRGGASDIVPARLPPPIAGWVEPDGIAIDEAALHAAWDALAGRHGVTGEVRFVRADGVRPRTFVIEPRRAVVIVVPAVVAAPADRFAVLHELGHTLVAMISPAGMPRVLDEAVAAYVARELERAEHPWHAAAATAARARRGALAGALDRIECALPVLDPPSARIAERPPWALWHDPGAQAAYVAAEPLADVLAAAVGAAPGKHAVASTLAASIAAHRDAIDRRDTGL